MRIPLSLYSLSFLAAGTLATILEFYDGSPNCATYPTPPYQMSIIEESDLDICTPFNTSRIYSIHLEFLAPATRCHFFAYNATTDPDNVCAPNPLANISTFSNRGPCFVYPGFPTTAYKVTCDYDE